MITFDEKPGDGRLAVMLDEGSGPEPKSKSSAWAVVVAMPSTG